MGWDQALIFFGKSEEFSSHSPSALTQQLILLTDVFGKMRSTRSHLEGSQLDFILLNVSGSRGRYNRGEGKGRR